MSQPHPEATISIRPLAEGRLLMGPGPSNVHPRVLKAMGRPLLGHLDPEFLGEMDEVKEMLRQVFCTRNRVTLPISGTGSAGMEAVLVNFLEPGDEVIIGVQGLFGERMAEVASRAGARVVRVEVPWGEVIPPARLTAALEAHPRAKLLALVQAETSTGVHQPIEAAAAACRKRETLFLVDAVTSLGGLPLEVDGWGLDLCYSGTQKCLSVPPGLAPLTVSEKAERVLAQRRTPIQSWYLDLKLLLNYWGGERAYHHTAPVSMIFGLREGLRLVLEEGLEARWQRHQELGHLLRDGLEGLGFKLLPPREQALPMLTAVRLPEGFSDLPNRRRLLEEFQVEVGGGLGPLKGQVWRIGLMGETCRREHVEYFLEVVERLLREQ